MKADFEFFLLAFILVVTPLFLPYFLTTSNQKKLIKKWIKDKIKKFYEEELYFIILSLVISSIISYNWN